ncbi:2838_t:CDS:2 [Entrophospora sp. SA101]|nr:2838_t:CDS:2 [Entrophospora sp. SA101]
MSQQFLYQKDYLDQKHPKSGVSGPHYLIHYKEPRVLKFNETNLSKQKQIEESFNRKNKASTGKKRRREQSIDKDEIIKKPIIAIPIPETLRAMLVQDWENINKSQLVSVNVTDKNVVRLPRKPSVVDIIDHYKLYQKKKYSQHNSLFNDGSTEEIINGILYYFNKCLGTRLLYQLERQQYKDLKNKFDKLENSQLYGAEHFLRLFGK